MPSIRFLPVFFAAILGASPAYATVGGMVLPEPSSLFLLGMGVAGVVVGRKFSSKNSED